MELEVVIGGQNEEILTKVSGFVAGFSGFLLMKKKKSASVQKINSKTNKNTVALAIKRCPHFQ